MTALIQTHPAAGRGTADGEDTATTAPTVRRRPAPWRLAGAVAAPVLFAFPIVGMTTSGSGASAELAAQGAAAVTDALAGNGTALQVSGALCFLGAVLLLAFGIGFARLLEQRLPAGHGLVTATRLATAAALGGLVLVGGLKAALRGTLPDHMDHTLYVQDSAGLLVAWIEQLQYVPLWAMVPVLLGSAVVAFGHRALPRWFGAVSGLLAVGAVLALAVAGLPYLAGLVVPLWLVAASVAGVRDRGTVQA